MPLKSIPNPYDFVPLEGTQSSRIAWSEEQYGVDRYRSDRYSGCIHCILHPETPIFVHGQEQQQGDKRSFFRIGGRPGIPAASLKGALRSIYEIVTNGCFSSVSDEYKSNRGAIKISKRLPSAYMPCHDLKKVCPACLLFGMMEQEVEEAKGLAGRLSFSDATPVKTSFKWQKMPKQGGGPQPRHTAFYFQKRGAGDVLGRKLYFHHSDYLKTIAFYGDRGKLMEVEMHSGDFKFSIDFTNLTDQELSYLCYTLLLEEDIRHHMAYGKAYGLGSARINIQRIDLLCGPTQAAIDRYLLLDPDTAQTIDPVQRATDGKTRWMTRTGTKLAYDAFKKILAWPGTDLYKYPDYKWFKNTSGSGDVTLSEYQSGIRTQSSQQPAPRTNPPHQSEAQSGKRQQGKVLEFFEDKRFGFIRADDGRKLLVHFTAIRRGGPRSLEKGQRVEFNVEEAEKGPRAVDVVLIGNGGN